MLLPIERPGSPALRAMRAQGCLSRNAPGNERSGTWVRVGIPQGPARVYYSGSEAAAPPLSEGDCEALWRFLDEDQQQALRKKLEGGKA